MFLILFDVLQEFLLFTDEKSSSSQVSAITDPLIDVNNNDLPTITCDIKQHDFNAGTMKDLESNPSCTSYSVPSTAVFSKNCNLASKKISTTRDIGLSMKDTFDATSFPTSYEKCRKSSYRDISKDFCAEKMVKLKRLKSPRHPRCNLTCHLRKAKDSLSLQEKCKLPCKIECLNDRETLPTMESFPLLITDKQGLIEIHISRLNLSTSITKIPDEEDICNLHVYVSWDIWGEKTAYTPRMKCPILVFNSSSVYRIADLFSFFKNVLSEYLIFRVNIVRRDNTCYTPAQAKVSIKDILDYPQNKLHYIVPVNSIISSFLGINFGQLSLWVRLSCNVDMVEAFKKQCGISPLKDKDILYAPPVEKETRDKLQKPFLQDSTRRIVDVPLKDQQQKDRSLTEDSIDQDTQLPSDLNFQHETEILDDENDYNSNNEESHGKETNEMYEEENGMIKVRSSDSKADDSNERKKNASRDSARMEFKTLLANVRYACLVMLPKTFAIV